MKKSPEKSSVLSNPLYRLAIIAILCGVSACDVKIDDVGDSGLNDIKRDILSSYIKTQTHEKRRLAALMEAKEREGEEGEIEIPLCSELSNHGEPGPMPKKMKKKKRKEDAQIVCAVDGDTFDVKLDNYNDAMIRVRIWGADCPESSANKKCMKKGKEKCEEEIKVGKNVSKKVRRMLGDGEVELQPPYKKNGNRVLAYMHVRDNVDLGRSLVSSCLCKEGYKHKRKKNYRKAGKRCKK